MQLGFLTIAALDFLSFDLGRRSHLEGFSGRQKAPGMHSWHLMDNGNLHSFQCITGEGKMYAYMGGNIILDIS